MNPLQIEQRVRWLNRALLSLAILLVVSYLGLLIAGTPSVSIEAGGEQIEIPQDNGAFPTRLLLRDSSRYASIFSQRELFRLLVHERTRPLEADSAKSFKLLGITFDGKQYQAHVLEEKSQTYHTFHKGQYMGEYLIEDIDRSRVLLRSGEERLELRK